MQPVIPSSAVIKNIQTKSNLVDKNTILIPEDIWLLNNDNAIKINVKIQAFEDEISGFREQILSLEIDLKMKIEKIKELLSSRLNSNI